MAAPAAEIEGATEGGTITVHLPGDPGPTDLDPTNGWSVTGNSIQQALTSRSLTQYAKDPETGTMELVPDLATDLGTPNEDFTEWTFTIRDDATWENGEPVTAEEVAWGLCRSMDSNEFPSGPGTEYSQQYFFGAGEYEGPYTGNDPNCEDWGGVEVNGQDITIKMAKPFPDMDWWGSFMAMGPAPLGKASDSPEYGQNILSNGPYKVESFRPGEELVLVKNDQWNPESDPARTSTPTSSSSSSTPTRPRSTRSCSATTPRRRPDRRRRRARTTTSGSSTSSETAWSSRPRSAPASWRRTTTRSPTSTSARRSRGPTPTRTSGWPAVTSRA